jgi:N-acetylglucosamine-6-sulfatase
VGPTHAYGEVRLKHFRRTTLMLVLGAFAALLSIASTDDTAQARPNIVLIVTDDQRWDTLAYMPTVQSELIAKGATFSNAFVVNPVCCPSRASILTGKWSHSTGVWGIDGDYGGFHVFRDGSTLPVWLRAAGYHTGLVGKYLNGYLDDAYVPPGWDRWFANTTNPNGYFDWSASDNGTKVAFGHEPSDYSTDVLASQAVEFIRNSGSQPFFLYFTPKAPHIDTPMHVTPAPRHVGAYADLPAWRPPSLNEADVSDKPRYVRNHYPLPTDQLGALREQQLESLLAVDEGVAQILTALQDTDKLTNTLIVFMSDNGYGWGEHRLTHKVVPYEESIRVPLVIRWDALGLAPRTEPRFALNVDLAPTIAAAVGITAPGAEGRNLLPLLTGEQSGWRPSFLIENEMSPKWGIPAYCGFRGVRWKYVQYATGEEELYDLGRDPYELHSLHLVERTRIVRLRARVRESACRPPGYSPLRTVRGTRRADRIYGSRIRVDVIHARAGSDWIDVRGGGHDIVRCGRGFDHVRADQHDRLIGCEAARVS